MKHSDKKVGGLSSGQRAKIAKTYWASVSAKKRSAIANKAVATRKANEKASRPKNGKAVRS